MADHEAPEVVHVLAGRILLCTCGEMTEPKQDPGDMWRAFEAHLAEQKQGEPT